ncbi:hypothetical protein [Aquimarina muelleri]|uniref:Uncharacterized protein n=1 Tax=Aquimarina muelleri TaxID=279356 RepID=A0A918JZ18_9FLAO|nr:hypothetical protein [Aquimarina muelleri]MCX2765044.1 hypothetical protein [Aquimarina muelleri]GGX35760.1 hypothetical protein GCM10007384_39650 [Aquimarina muelleri]
MIEFLKQGKKLNNIHMGMSVEDVYNKLGEPDEIVGDDNNGYLHYKEFRYGYNVSRSICEMSIEFNYLENKYKFKGLENEQYGEIFYESFTISSKTKIHKFLRFLNYLKLSWEADSSGDKENFTIKLKPGPFIVFDLQDGTPFRISVMDGYQ